MRDSIFKSLSLSHRRAARWIQVSTMALVVAVALGSALDVVRLTPALLLLLVCNWSAVSYMRQRDRDEDAMFLSVTVRQGDRPDEQRFIDRCVVVCAALSLCVTVIGALS
jgi:hypothetical protein